MQDFIQKQLEASERLFEMMREDHKERMREIEVWAEASNSLMKKLDERDATITLLRTLHAEMDENSTITSALERQEELNALHRRIKILELQLEHFASHNKELAKANASLRDRNDALNIDLHLKP
jgi:predicted RNase H-like nuclease (RuvC/YqgF family)